MQNNKKPSRKKDARDASGAKKCTSIFSSMTAAMKFQNVLASHGIKVSVIKADASLTGRGCSFGISYLCEQKDEIRRIIDSASASSDFIRHIG
jgi:ribosomal protein S11